MGIKLVPPGRVELPTPRLRGACSGRLSYKGEVVAASGIEPHVYRLSAGCSAIELRRDDVWSPVPELNRRLRRTKTLLYR